MVIYYSYGKPLLQEGLSLFNKSLGHYSTASSFRSVLYDVLAIGDSWASVALPLVQNPSGDGFAPLRIHPAAGAYCLSGGIESR